MILDPRHSFAYNLFTPFTVAFLSVHRSTNYRGFFLLLSRI